MAFRFFPSRRFLTVIALMVTGIVVGNFFGGQEGQRWQAQVTGGGTCGNNSVETGEECEQDVDCPGSMKCMNCLCREKTQCWNNDQWPFPYCNKETALLCGVDKQCENCICHSCSQCLLERSLYTSVTSMTSYNSNPEVSVRASRLSDTSIAVALRQREFSYTYISMGVKRFDLSGKHVLNAQPTVLDIANALSSITAQGGSIESAFEMAALDATHVVIGVRVSTNPSNATCYALVADLGTSPALGTPVEFPAVGQSCGSFTALASLSPTKFVAAAGNKFVVGDVNLSTRAITFGSAISPQGGNAIHDMIALDTARVMASVYDNTCSDNCQQSFVVGTVSGTSIQWATPTAVQTPTGRSVEFVSANASKVLFFNGTPNWTDRLLKLATVQGNAITVGDPTFGLPTLPQGIQVLSAVAFSPEQALLNVTQYSGGSSTYNCSGTSPCTATEQMIYRDPNDYSPEPPTINGESTAGIALTDKRFVFFPIVRHTSQNYQSWNDYALQIGAISCPTCGAACGNGRIDGGEQCGEPGLASCPANTACQHCTCAVKQYATVCGDGNVTYPSEQCDWGNAQFAPGAEYYNPGGTLTNAVAIAAADLDGDGKQDFVIADRASGNIPDSSAMVWSNKGTYFEAVYPGWSLLEHPRELVVRDFNRDGKQDIVFTTYERPYLIYAKGNGDGRIQGSALRLFGGVLSSEYNANRNLVAADFNQDAYPDIAFSYGLNKTAVSLGSANGFANPVVVSDQGLQHLATAVGDFDRDAKPDLVLLRNVGAGTVVSVLKGTGNGTFQTAQDYSIEPTNPRAGPVVVADINGDNYDDIVAEPAFSKRLSILINNRNGTFTITTSANGVLNSPTFCLADYNSDGRKDLIAGEYELNLLSVYFGKSDGTFSTAPDRMMKEQYVMTDFLCEDLDGDNKVDIAMVHGTPQGPLEQGYSYGHDQYNNTSHAGLLSLCLSGQGGCELKNPCASGTCNGATCQCEGTTPASSSSSSAPVLPSSSSSPATVFDLSAEITGPSTIQKGQGSQYTVVVRNKGTAVPTARLHVNFGTMNAATPNLGTYPFCSLLDTHEIFCSTISYQQGQPTATYVFSADPQPVACGGSVEVRATVSLEGSDDSVPTDNIVRKTVTVQCASSQSSAGVAGCGNGMLETGKQCDVPAMRTTMTTSPSPGTVVTGDFNRDGKMDFATMGYPTSPNGTSIISTFLNRGDGSFFAKVDYSLESGQQVLSFQAEDVNGDDKLDFLVKSNGQLKVLKGNGDGTFQTITGLLPGNPVMDADQVAVGDFNEDGRADIMTSTYSGMNPAETKFFAGQANGTFAAGVTVSGYPHPWHKLVAADFDADGHLDIAYNPASSSNDPPGSTFDGSVQVLYGNGAGAFTSVPIPEPSMSVSNMMGIFVRDVNSDSRPDLVIRGNGSISHIWLNNGNRTFQEKTTNGGVMGDSLSYFDIDGDGKMDVITTAYSTGFGNKLEVHKGIGDGTFVQTAAYTIPLPYDFTCLMSAIVGADFNGDGKLDMAVAHGNACNDAVANANAVSVFLSPCAPGQTCASCQCTGGVSSSSRSSVGAPVCGNGALENGEGCDTGYPCSTGYSCNASCQCIAVSSSSFSSSSSSKKSSSSSSTTVTASSSSSAQPVSSSSSSAQPSSSSSSSSVSVIPAVCPNGELESGEQCEIGYACPEGSHCTTGCVCTNITTSSVSSSVSSSVTQSSASSATIQYNVCGNGIIEGAEVCEAGHTCGTGQYCSDCQCLTPRYCGDGQVNTQASEECESDDDCPGDEFCTLNCLCHADTGGNCGNGNLEAQEECERNHPCGDGEQCQSCVCVDVPRCGNSALERGEQCEVNDACPAGSSCVNCLCEQSAACGNGILGAGEQCEQDSHCATGQYCNRLTCKCEGTSPVTCGDGILTDPEMCELGQPCSDVEEICNLSDCSCVLDAVTSLCGNAQVDAGEDCDIGTPCGDGEMCNFSGCHCVPWEQRCGDAQRGGEEECDIGNPCADSEKACDMSQCICAVPSGDQICGNGAIEIGEECEVGMACPFGWSCDFPHCRCMNQPVCGDAVQNSGEQCEINVACSGASQTCDFSRCRCVGNLIACGNGVMDPGEQCDDGNTWGDDGCSATCQREWATMVGGIEACGNGIVEEGEQCDDGNRDAGDGCSLLCQWEMSVQTPSQGGGLVNGGTWSLGADHPSGPIGGYLEGQQPTPGTSGSQQGAQGQAARPGSQTIVFPGQQGWGMTAQQQGLQGGQQQYFPAFYGSAVPYAPSGPVGQTGPASVAVIAAGAAAGFAWMRRKRQQ